VNQPVSGETKADASDFPYLKRDLVRLLGILCHNRKAIQDRIRVCGGISVVLNLCTIDDRNPCKFPFWAALARMLFCSCLVSRRMSLSHTAIQLRFTFRPRLIMKILRLTRICYICAAKFTP
jgi:hypothetical protein